MLDLIGSHNSRKIAPTSSSVIYVTGLLENVELDYEDIARQQRLNAFKEAVQAARQLEDDIRKYGLDAAYLYCDDVDGDWLETWGDDEEEQG